MQTTPYISVVTPCFNRVSMVADAVESVLNQNYQRFEHIITDGGSTDGTLDVLKRYHHLRVYSAPDRNLYDAVNKGIDMARGDIIGFLNTDDYYPPAIFPEIAAAFLSNPRLDVVYGGAATIMQMVDGSRNEIAKYCLDSQLSFRNMAFAFGQFAINSRFFHRRVYDRVGKYNISYSLGADFEFMIRVAATNPTALFVPRLTYIYRAHEGSLTFDPRKHAQVTVESLAVVEDVITRLPLRAADKRALLRFHSMLCAGESLVSLRRGSIRQSVRWALRGLRVSPLWPIALGEEIVRFIGRSAGIERQCTHSII